MWIRRLDKWGRCEQVNLENGTTISVEMQDADSWTLSLCVPSINGMFQAIHLAVGTEEEMKAAEGSLWTHASISDGTARYLDLSSKSGNRCNLHTFTD